MIKKDYLAVTAPDGNETIGDVSKSEFVFLLKNDCESPSQPGEDLQSTAHGIGGNRWIGLNNDPQH